MCFYSLSKDILENPGWNHDFKFFFLLILNSFHPILEEYFYKQALKETDFDNYMYLTLWVLIQ